MRKEFAVRAADVDDLIFTDDVWARSEREKQNAAKGGHARMQAWAFSFSSRGPPGALYAKLPQKIKKK